MKSDKLKGSLDLLILKTLRRGEAHGYGIALHIESVSDGALEVEEGSLYPALHRLENRGFVKSNWKQAPTGRRARFYSLTKKGAEELERKAAEWRQFSEKLAHFLDAG
jgi:transcriptional regulator